MCEHYRVEFLLPNFFALLDLVLKRVDSRNVVAFLLMSLLLRKVLDCLMELFVLLFALFVLKLLYFLLLFQKSCLNLFHMVI